VGYQNPGVYHEEKACGEDLVLLEIIGPVGDAWLPLFVRMWFLTLQSPIALHPQEKFGTVDLPSSSALNTKDAEGGPVSPSGDTFAVSHAKHDGSEFVSRHVGECMWWIALMSIYLSLTVFCPRPNASNLERNIRPNRIPHLPLRNRPPSLLTLPLLPATLRNNNPSNRFRQGPAEAGEQLYPR
jgi:hypothetical protein